MTESYKGFNIDIERTDNNSPYHWGVEGEEHVYWSGTAEDSSSAWEQATEWINFYLKSLPKTENAKIAVKHQQILKEVVEALEKVTDVDYCNHHQRIVSGGLRNKEALLDNALEKIREALRINEQVIRSIKAFPDEDLETAIRRYLQSNHD
ncbi:hypothetical protein I8748_05630 [Nostoc sp. CENA67]|uniref:Uncharacterized protein n=1 Tax=Amazonocrinis nigriterrae CENA67 TaxID=2794033 RepID=A0A8J7L5W3_9NOST|nr:hypothetical protein [Amazonocrinis nigriterrae]MBH8561664.1 hypothetical protein [Amazonocrinis nigriterrae CENA67]